MRNTIGGSLLGPFLLNIMVNDLPSSLPCECIMYADDVTLINCHKEMDKLEHQKRTSLQVASEWFTSNSLHLNSAKTDDITFSLTNRSHDPKVVKLLGFYLDSTLNWCHHISSVCSKISQILYALRKLKPMVDLGVLRTVYFSLLQCHINYGIILWGHSSGVKDILLLQKKAVRVMMGRSRLDHCKPLFKELKIMTVYNLFIYRLLVYTKENIKKVLFA
jgi:hypothetical protein